jgi:hypothetical protein
MSAISLPDSGSAAWRPLAQDPLDSDDLNRYVECLRSAIPECSGYGTNVDVSPDAWWFISTHPGLAATLWIRPGGSAVNQEAGLSWALGGSARRVAVEFDRWERVLAATIRGMTLASPAKLTPSLHIGSVRHDARFDWVISMGGPLVAVPEAVKSTWSGFTDDESGSMSRDDDYDRACAIAARAGVIAFGDGEARALVLRHGANTCFLPDRHLFAQWLGADSDEDFFMAVNAVLADPGAQWDDNGIWDIDGPAVLMDSFVSGQQLSVPYHDGSFPAQARIPISAGRWSVRSGQWDVPLREYEFAKVGLVQLLL